MSRTDDQALAQWALRGPLPGALQIARFRAMGSPCELLAETDDAAGFLRVAQQVEREVTRIECKYTRFGDGGVLALLRRHPGRRVWLDAETARLIDIAAHWHRRSGGLFDVTGGALQRLWRFGAAAAPPDAVAVECALAHTGFARLRWEAPRLQLPPGMELDLGGLCKEYAVDRAHDLLAAQLDAPALVNLGGDLRVTRARRAGPWRIGLERGDGSRAGGRVVEVESGAVATSGSVRRHVESGGVRHGHVLDPRTGWPAKGLRSATVVHPDATLADALSTALLVLGRERGFEVAGELGAEALVIDAEGDLAFTPGLAARLELLAPPRRD